MRRSLPLHLLGARALNHVRGPQTPTPTLTPTLTPTPTPATSASTAPGQQLATRPSALPALPAGMAATACECSVKDADWVPKSFRKQPAYFHSKSRSYLNWVLCMLAVLSFEAFFVPFRLVFCTDCFFPSLDVLVDVLLLMDVYIGFHLSYIDANDLVRSRKRIVKHYLFSWFLIDAVALLPLNILFYLLPSSFNWLRILRLVKLMKSLHYAKLLERDKRFQLPLLRLLEFNFGVFLLAHWIGCLWFSLAFVECFGCNRFVPPISLMTADLQSQFLSSFYWAFTAMTGSELEPATKLETIFSAFVIFIGLSTYATIIGNVGSLISKFDSSDVVYQRKMEEISIYMAYRRLPIKLQQRIQNYYEYLWSRRKGLDEEDLLQNLPESLRAEVALFLNQDIITKVPFFASCTQDFIRQIVSMLKPRVSIPGECLILQNSLGNEMFFLSGGHVEVLVDGVAVNILSSGSFFGEYALLFPHEKRTATVRALTYCELFVLRKKDFDRVLAAFPEFEEHLRTTALRRLHSVHPPLAASPTTPSPSPSLRLHR